MSTFTLGGRPGASRYPGAGDAGGHLSIVMHARPVCTHVDGRIHSMRMSAKAEYAVRAMKRMIRERVTAVEVKSSFEARWYRWLQSRMEGTSWTMSNNYFKSPTGKIVTQWPYSNMEYRVLTKVLGRMSETTSRRGA